MKWGQKIPLIYCYAVTISHCFTLFINNVTLAKLISKHITEYLNNKLSRKCWGDFVRQSHA